MKYYGVLRGFIFQAGVEIDLIGFKFYSWKYGRHLSAVLQIVGENIKFGRPYTMLRVRTEQKIDLSNISPTLSLYPLNCL